ncbi:MAG: hypothetical protein RL375_2626 [Pseudomonadota bacterium]
MHSISRRGIRVGVLNVYRCCHCGSFHIGHKLAKSKERKWSF